MDPKTRMMELIAKINQASEAYYVDEDPIMSDHAFDALVDELAALEQSSGIILAKSPTQRVGGDVMEGLAKVIHTKPMLSAAKTKSVEEMTAFAKKSANQKNPRIMLSWKLDGLTLVLRYKKGVLVQIITRGNGEVGEDVTHNASALMNVPRTLPTDEDLEIRGECVVSRENFDAVNQDLEEEYTLARSYAGGSIRLFDPSEANKRMLDFFSFELVSPQMDSLEEGHKKMSALGLPVVPYKMLSDWSEMAEAIESFHAEEYAYYVDGLIAEYDDRSFGRSLGATGHHENCRYAFKWNDLTHKTHLLDVIRRTTRTGRVSLTALFEPVDIDGSTVSHATLHNYDIFRSLKLGIGDELEVFKANMIIPAIDQNNTQSDTFVLDMHCPCCGSELQIWKQKRTHFLRCPNQDCSARHLRQFEHFVSRPAANIVGLSKSKLEDLLTRGFIKDYADLYHLEQYRAEIEQMEGWGPSSFENLQSAIETSRKMELSRLIVCFGIPQVGKHAGKIIHTWFKGDPDAFMQAVDEGFDFHNLPDFGDVMCDNLVSHFADPTQRALWDKLLKEFELSKPVAKTDASAQVFAGKTLVATGSFANFSRDSMNQAIEAAGGKAGSSVSKKTDYVIAGEKAGSKLQKARDLGIPILTEAEFLAMLGK